MLKHTRLIVLLVSALLVAIVVTGGILSHALAREGSYQHLRVFEDVVSLVMSNYVEDVNTSTIMQGAMHGLADGLDPESAYLTTAQVNAITRRDAMPPAGVGLELTRQYYLRVVAAREGSPAARAGIRTGDFIRSIDETPTRDMSVVTGARLLRGAPGSRVKLSVIRGNAAEPHEMELVREAPAPLASSSRMVNPRIALVRLPVFARDAASDLRTRFEALEDGTEHVIIDLRGNAEGPLEEGLAAARLFVAEGTLGAHQSRANKSLISARPGDGTITLPLTLLVDGGTAGAAELFAAALDGNERAALIGERTTGRAAMQELVRLPDGTGLWLTTSRYLTPKDAVIHGKGLTPDIVVEAPDVEFGEPAPTEDPVLDKAIEQASSKLQTAA